MGEVDQIYENLSPTQKEEDSKEEGSLVQEFDNSAN